MRETNSLPGVWSVGTQREKQRSEIKEREAWCEELLLAPCFSPIFWSAIFRAAPEKKLNTMKRLDKFRLEFYLSIDRRRQGFTSDTMAL